MNVAFNESDSMLLNGMMISDQEIGELLDDIANESDCVRYGAPMVDLTCDEMEWQREYICIDSAFRIARS